MEDHNGYSMIHQCDKSGLVFLKIDISSGTTVQKLISTWETYMRNIQQLIFSFLSQTGYRFIGQSVTDVKKMKRCTVYFSLPKQFYIVQHYLPSRLRLGGELPSTVFGLRAEKVKNQM